LSIVESECVRLEREGETDGQQTGRHACVRERDVCENGRLLSSKLLIFVRETKLLIFVRESYLISLF